jgi:hypothetical protein
LVSKFYLFPYHFAYFCFVNIFCFFHSLSLIWMLKFEINFNNKDMVFFELVFPISRWLTSLHEIKGTFSWLSAESSSSLQTQRSKGFINFLILPYINFGHIKSKPCKRLWKLYTCIRNGKKEILCLLFLAQIQLEGFECVSFLGHFAQYRSFFLAHQIGQWMFLSYK